MLGMMLGMDAKALLSLAKEAVKAADYAHAIELLESAIKKNPNSESSHYLLAHCLLATGDFKRGWDEYEWRFKIQTYKMGNLSIPLWDGSQLKGRRLMVQGEQGLGDTIQFSRYVPMLDRLGGT